MNRRKPRGVSGPVYVSATGERGSFVPIEWPDEKDELEQAILNAALSSAGDLPLPFELRHPPRQNSENHFDFTLVDSGRDAYLDLMEVAPLDLVRGSYNSAQARYHHGEIVDWIFDKIRSKSDKYTTEAPIHLLLYTTDWRFHLGPNVLRLLAHYCHHASLVFTSILYFAPDDLHNGSLDLVYPRTVEQRSVADETVARETITAMGNPSAAVFQPGGSVVIPLSSSEEGEVAAAQSDHPRPPGVRISGVSFEYPAGSDQDSTE